MGNATARTMAVALLFGRGLVGCASSAVTAPVAVTAPPPVATVEPAAPGPCDTADACNTEGAAALMVRDYGRATDLLERACTLGGAAGCANLAGMFRRGDGVASDGGHAVTLYDKACEQGEIASCDDLGLMLHEGEGVAVDDVRALWAFEKGCKGGNADACYNAGVLYERGLGVAVDQGHAQALFESACDAGHPAGCARAGIWLYKGSSGRKDYARAVAFLRKACDKFDPDGCLNLGMATLQGHGVDASPSRALDLFQRACERGNDEACNAARQIEAEKAAGSGANVTEGRVTAGGLRVEDLACRTKGTASVTAADVVAGLATQRASFDDCMPEGDAPLVTWSFAAGRVEDAKVTGAHGPGVAACVEHALRRVRSMVEGTCSAVVLIGETKGAERALAKHRGM